MINAQYNISQCKHAVWIAVCLMIIVVGVQPVKGQFVESHITIQTVQFSVTSELIASDFYADPVTRIGISAKENVPILVELGIEENRTTKENPDALWLNDGSGDIENAIPFKDNRALFRLDNHFRLIGSLHDEPYRLTAWIFLIRKPTDEGKTHISLTYL